MAAEDELDGEFYHRLSRLDVPQPARARGSCGADPEAPATRERLWEILKILLNDHRQAWEMRSDGSYGQQGRRRRHRNASDADEHGSPARVFKERSDDCAVRNGSLLTPRPYSRECDPRLTRQNVVADLNLIAACSRIPSNVALSSSSFALLHADRRSPSSSVVLTGGFVVAEAAAGWIGHSLALLSDAGHNLADVLALLVSWYALEAARRPSSAQRTYGSHRVGIFAALLNAFALVLIAVLILLALSADCCIPRRCRGG